MRKKKSSFIFTRSTDTYNIRVCFWLCVQRARAIYAFSDYVQHTCQTHINEGVSSFLSFATPRPNQKKKHSLGINTLTLSLLCPLSSTSQK